MENIPAIVRILVIVLDASVAYFGVLHYVMT